MEEDKARMTSEVEVALGCAPHVDATFPRERLVLEELGRLTHLLSTSHSHSLRQVVTWPIRLLNLHPTIHNYPPYIRSHRTMRAFPQAHFPRRCPAPFRRSRATEPPTFHHQSYLVTACILVSLLLHGMPFLQELCSLFTTNLGQYFALDTCMYTWSRRKFSVSI